MVNPDLRSDCFRGSIPAGVGTVPHLQGSLNLNHYRDQGILHLVADSQYVTHSQLFYLAGTEWWECDRAVFNWRIQRMVADGLVRKHILPWLHSEPLYSIKRAGLEVLEQLGIDYLSSTFERERDECESHIRHALEVNNIRLTLLQSRRLDRWIPESFIRILNLSPVSAYAKVYDGIARILLDAGFLELAVEYQGTFEGSAKYEKIREAIDLEGRLKTFLYLVRNRDLLFDLLPAFWGTKQIVFFGLIHEFKRDGFMANVQSTNDYSSISLGKALMRAKSASFRP